MRDIITKLEELNVENPQLNEGLGELAHEAEKDHEVQMARSDLYKIAKYAVAIHKMLKDRSEMDGLEGWVQSKITKSADYMGAVKHYMEGEAMQDVELAVVPVAGDMTDAMTMPEESVEEEIQEAVEVTEDREVMVRATNIDYAGPALDKLPTDVNVKVMVNPGDDEDDIFDAVADELEDRYGVKVNGFDMKMMEDMSDEEIDDFHKELDDVVHKHLGHSSDEEEMNEEDVIGDIIANLQKVGVGKKGKTPQKPRMALPKPKPAEPIGSDPETGATKGLPPEEVYSPQQLQQIANQNRITKPALKKESKFADWSKK
jgi:hypothetical protein